MGGDGWQNLDDDGFSPRVLVLDDSGAGASAEPLPLLEIPSKSLSHPRPLFLETTATSVAATTVVGPPDCQEWNADNRMECWLWQLAVESPSQSFSADWISLFIHHGRVCTHFALHHLHSKYIVPHAVGLSVNTLQATCKGMYDMPVVAFPRRSKPACLRSLPARSRPIVKRCKNNSVPYCPNNWIRSSLTISTNLMTQ